jgi:acyl-homoserine-lactone acylase
LSQMLRRPHAVLSLVAVALAAAVVAAPASAKARYDAKIVRTSYGIPHVSATSWGSLGYGAGYAYAEDNLCTLAQEIVTVSAARARSFGVDGTTISSAKNADNNLESDFFWQSVHDARTVEKLVARKAPLGPKTEVKAMVAGYAAGYNAYLKKTGVAKLPDPRCRGKAWVRPITALDLWKRYYQLAVLASSGNFVHELTAAAPPSGTAAASAAALERPSAGAIGDWFHTRLGDDHPEGSNGIGLGSEATQDRHGIVLGNPHFPWIGGERFYQFQLTLPGKIDVQGSSLSGIPVVNIGFNKDVAWTHTVSTARRFTIFRLQLARNDPKAYVYNGKTYKMTSRTVKVKTNTGAVKTHTYWYSRLGPVMQLAQAGYNWDRTNAYVLGDANADNMRVVNVWFDMDRATSVDGLVRAQSQDQGVPWVNTIAADRTGTALYQDNTVVPAVNKALIAKCIPDGLPKIVYSAANVITLDGTRSSCGWANDPGAVVKGIMSPRHLPIIKRKDFVQNANDSYWFTNPKHLLTGFSPIIGSETGPLGLRPRYGVNKIQQRLAGTDGLPGKGFTTANLRDLWQRADSLAGVLIKDQLADLCQANPTVVVDGQPVDVSGACPVLRNWDAKGTLDSRGAWLFQVWWMNAGSVFSDAFDPNNPLTTPNRLATSQDNITALGQAVRNLQAAGLPLDATNRQAQHAYDEHGTKVPVPGCGSNCYEAIYAVTDAAAESRTQGVAVRYGQVYDGSSTVMQIDMGPKGPSGQTILTYSESENPKSPHHADQTKLFSAGRWVPVTFTKAQIAKDAKSTYRVR